MAHCVHSDQRERRCHAPGAGVVVATLRRLQRAHLLQRRLARCGRCSGRGIWVTLGSPTSPAAHSLPMYKVASP